MTKVQVHNFGCRLNIYEGAVIEEKLTPNDEGLIVFNTCAVTGEAVRQARQAIRKARREHPDARIVVTGCAAQIDPAAFGEMGEVDRVLGNKEKFETREYDFGIDGPKVRVNDIMAVKENAGHLIGGFTEHHRAFVEVQNGCDHRCTFCIIPYGRGNSRSIPAGAIVEQIQTLVAGGYREVVLTGVDLTSYGADLPGKPQLGDLVQRILKLVPELPRLRISSIDSIEADEALIDAIVNDQRVMPHLHLSLQAGDNLILKRMKRRHSREDAIAFTQEIKSKRPEVTFGADIIAGFPTESEEMFENSLRLVDDCDLTYLHVFPYSARTGTPAARMPQLPMAVRKDRAARLRAKGAERLNTHLASKVGQQVEALIERVEDGIGFGHSNDFAPVRCSGDVTAGTISTVTIDSAHETYVKGTISK